MPKILLMPLLRMSSGHHQVADSIMESLKEGNLELEFQKVELLSYSLGFLETIITGTYLKSIKVCPALYSWLYRKVSFNDIYKTKRYILYEILFLRSIKKVLNESNPDLIICTHALPSYLLNKLKQQSGQRVPVINVYTDFFVNQLWGLSHIDYHFAPTQEVKQFLCSQGVEYNQIHVTGIPVHPSYSKNESKQKTNEQNDIHLLISGGSLGTGNIKKLLKNLKPSGKIHYKVLCGKNKKLFQFVQSINSPNITPLPYITCKNEMNALYSNSSGIITKPGGVTISETLRKKLPIFIYSVLPGQEEINLRNLKNNELVFLLENDHKDLENQILDYLTSQTCMNRHRKQVNMYLNSIENEVLSETLVKILTNKHHL
ncbi:MGDG synthase family glycosyltransferase [Metabacillus sp. Hm71]|uniref:MGDG synthase family glycosyltransferase n=1 Tax=Metabacillus sp. Hm71 TaxID=3450743 RepID=UPI003F43577B